MPFGLLGPLEVRNSAGALIEVRGRQPRIVLSMLLAANGRSVSVDGLIDAIWGDSPAASATGTLQTYVSRLRRIVEPAGGTLSFDDTGYRLIVSSDDVDLNRFESRADRGRALLAEGRPAEARELLLEADALWRGQMLADLVDVDAMVALTARLEERRLVAIEDRLAADLLLGRHAIVAAELAELVALHPLRENLQHQLALALYRSGRQADALRALNDAASHLREELGIEPSRQLRDLEAAILAHDPALDLPDVRPPEAVDAETDAAGVVVGPALEGRDHELGELIAALDEARSAARFVVVEGEPGIGKTRLVEELGRIAESRHALVVWGRSDERGAAPALWPWLPPIRRLADAIGSDAGDVAEGEPTNQFARFQAIADLFDSAASRSPVVALLDDLQWADDDSLALLGFLTRALQSPVLVVATVRELEVGRHDALTDALALVARRPGSRRIQLRGLTSDATAAIVQGAEHELSESAAEAIHARAEGNPFYAIELARLLSEEVGLDRAVPATVSDVIRRRLSALPADTFELLELGAVVGRDVDVGVLARAADLEVSDCAERLESALVLRVVVDAPDRLGSVRFNHALVREVLLDGITSLRQARMHAKVADAIESTAVGVDELEILADHLWRAAPVGAGPRAVSALERAAEVAASRAAYRTAETLLTRSVHLRRMGAVSQEDLEAELETILRLLEMMRATHYFQSADRAILHRAEELADRLGRADVALDLRWLQCVALEPGSREMARLSRSYLALTAEDPRPHVRASGEQVYAVWCWGSGRIPEAVEHFDRALELVDGSNVAGGVLDAERAMITRRFAIVNHALLGDTAMAAALEEMRALAAGTPDGADVVSVCGFASNLAALAGRWNDLEDFEQMGLAADPSSQFAFWGGHLLMSGAIAAAHRGDVDAGAAAFSEARARYVDAGGTSALAAYDAFMAMVSAKHGRLDVAAHSVAAARRELDTRHERWTESVVLSAEAVVAHGAGDGETARERLVAAASVAAEQGALGLLRRVGEIASEIGLPLDA